MCQEVAHTFGLGHQSEDDSSQNPCMDYFSNTGANAGSTVSTKPNQHGFDMLKSIYSHLDSSTMVASFSDVMSAAADADVTDDPNSWGALVKQSANRRSLIYKRHKLSGSKTLTHVFWTIEAAERCKSCDHRHGLWIRATLKGISKKLARHSCLVFFLAWPASMHCEKASPGRGGRRQIWGAIWIRRQSMA